MTGSRDSFSDYAHDSYGGAKPPRSGGTIVAGLFVAALVIGGAVFAFWYATRVEYEPNAVFAALAGWPAGQPEPARDNLAEELGDNGLKLAAAEIVPAGVTLEEAAYWAADYGASHALMFAIEPVSSRPGVAEGQVLVVARVTGQGMSLGRDDPGRLVQIELAEQQPTAAEALAGIGADAVRILSQELMAEIVDTEVVQAFAKAEPHTLTDVQQAAANVLVERKSDAIEMRDAAAGFTRQCARSSERLAAERGAAQVRCYGSPCAQEYAVDLVPGGRDALVQVEQSRCFFFLERPSAERAALIPERLDLVALDGSSRRVLDTAKNYYGFASAAPTGDRVLFVENYGADYAVVELALTGGQRRILARFRRPERVAFPRLSPDGRWISLMYRRGPEQYRAMVMEAGGGQLVELMPNAYHHQWVEVPWGTGGRIVLLAVVVLGSDALPHEHLVLHEPDSKTPFETIGGAEWPVTGLAGVRGYDVYFTSNDRSRGCRLGVFDMASREVRFIETPVCIDSATLAPDGSIVGIAPLPTDPADIELVRFDPAARTLTRLTSNDVRERTVMAAWGNRVLFEKAPEMFHVDFPLVHACSVTVDSMAAAPPLEIPDAGPDDAADGGFE